MYNGSLYTSLIHRLQFAFTKHLLFDQIINYVFNFMFIYPYIHNQVVYDLVLGAAKTARQLVQRYLSPVLKNSLH